MCEIWIIDRLFALSAKIADVQAKICQERFQLLFHLKPAVIRTDRNRTDLSCALSSLFMDQFDLEVVNDVLSKGGKFYIFGDTQLRTRFESSQIVFGNKRFRRFVTVKFLAKFTLQRIYNDMLNFRHCSCRLVFTLSRHGRQNLSY